MRIIRAEAPARAALAGNPSDGFGGATLTVALSGWRASAVVYEWPELEIVPSAEDGVSFSSVEALAGDVALNGYYGGLRLAKAALRRLALHADAAATPIGERTFSVRYGTTIPRGVGLGGSSAIVTAVLVAAAGFCGIELKPAELAQLALATETEELGIAAGLQDRAAQAFGGLTFMDFSGARPAYERLDPAGLPPLFVAWRERSAAPSGDFHGELRARWRSGDGVVAEVMGRLAGLTHDARAAALESDARRLGGALAGSLAQRRLLGPLDPAQALLAEIAAAHGAAANYTGSGGAVIGITPPDDGALRGAYEEAGCSYSEVSVAPAGARAHE